MLDYINGNKFLEMADFAIDFDHRDINTNLFRNDAIIYCKTDFLRVLFNFIRLSRRKYILISHMSDYPINEITFSKAPKSIIKWYAQNAIYEDERLIPIPLGLENHKGTSKGKFTNHQWFLDNVEKLKKVPKNFSLYCNWNQDTNREIRIPILEKLKKNRHELVIESGKTFEEYCTNMAKHKFVICPPGNGADTHRLWEALYLGCYPITIKNRIYEYYDLPILQIEDWVDLTADLLDDHFNKWHDVEEFEQLKMSYWTNLIKKEFSTLKI